MQIQIFSKHIRIFIYVWFVYKKVYNPLLILYLLEHENEVVPDPSVTVSPNRYRVFSNIERAILYPIFNASRALHQKIPLKFLGKIAGRSHCHHWKKTYSVIHIIEISVSNLFSGSTPYICKFHRSLYHNLLNFFIRQEVLKFDFQLLNSNFQKRECRRFF